MKKSWLAVLGVIVAVAIGVGVGYAVGDDGHAAGDTHGLGDDRMAAMMAEGSMPKMMKQFTTMMERLRASMTPEMRQQMDRDQMWLLMASGELQQMMDEHGMKMRGMPGMGGHGGNGH